MKRQKISPMTRRDLEKLPTKRLLARLKRLHQCQESLALSDEDCDNYVASDFIEFKESPNWIMEYNNLKEILAGREHIPKD